MKNARPVSRPGARLPNLDSGQDQAGVCALISASTIAE